MTPTRHESRPLPERIARLEDLEDIRSLDARYCRALDEAEWSDLVDSFAVDGEFIGLEHARGHAELRRLFAALTEGGLTAFSHHDVLTRAATDARWRYQRKQVSFEYFTPLREGWAPARFSLPAAAATHRNTTAREHE
jgi:hypothetical protein